MRVKLVCENCGYRHNKLNFDPRFMWGLLRKVKCDHCGKPAYWMNYYKSEKELVESMYKRQVYLRDFIPFPFRKTGQKTPKSLSI